MIFLCAKRSQIGASGGKQEMWMTPSTLKPRRMRQEPMVVIRNRLRKFFSSTFGKFSHFVCWSFFSKFYDERKEEKNPFREGKMFRLRKFFSTLWEMSWKGLLFGWENGIFLSCFLFSNRVSSLYSRFNRAAGSCDDDHVDNKKKCFKIKMKSSKIAFIFVAFWTWFSDVDLRFCFVAFRKIRFTSLYKLLNNRIWSFGYLWVNLFKVSFNVESCFTGNLMNSTVQHIGTNHKRQNFHEALLANYFVFLVTNPSHRKFADKFGLLSKKTRELD